MFKAFETKFLKEVIVLIEYIKLKGISLDDLQKTIVDFVDKDRKTISVINYVWKNPSDVKITEKRTDIFTVRKIPAISLCCNTQIYFIESDLVCGDCGKSIIKENS